MQLERSLSTVLHGISTLPNANIIKKRKSQRTYVNHFSTNFQLSHLSKGCLGRCALNLLARIVQRNGKFLARTI